MARQITAIQEESLRWWSAPINKLWETGPACSSCPPWRDPPDLIHFLNPSASPSFVPLNLVHPFFFLLSRFPLATFSSPFYISLLCCVFASACHLVPPYPRIHQFSSFNLLLDTSSFDSPSFPFGLGFKSSDLDPLSRIP